MERNGGVTAQWEQETTFATAGANTIIADDGSVLQFDASYNVRKNNLVMGSVGSLDVNGTMLGVNRRGVLSGDYNDAVLTADDTILAVSAFGAAFTIYELSKNDFSVLRSRSMASSAAGQRYVRFVRYVDMHYVDNQEFIFNQPGNQPAIFRESGLSLTYINTVSVLSTFMWRFAASKYLIGSQGDAGTWNIGDIGAWVNIPNVRWATIDRFVGISDTRAILTCSPFKNAANTFSGYCTVGYNGAGVYSATPDWKGIALGAVTVVVTNPISGPGYSECTFVRSDTTPAINYYLAPATENNSGNYYESAVGVHTPVNGYGKLTYIAGANTTQVAQLRICMIPFSNGTAIDGTPGYLSVAHVNINPSVDYLGVPLTGVGEFDEDYVPHIDCNTTSLGIIYRFDDRIFFIDIRTPSAVTIQRVSEFIYQVNSIDPINIIDTRKPGLQLGVNDYNGRIISFAPGAATGTHKLSATMKSDYANSIDTGDKLTSQIAPTGTTSIKIPGIGFVPMGYIPQFRYAVDIFYDDLYVISVVDYSSTTASAFKYFNSMTDELYVKDTRLPIALGYIYGDKVAYTNVLTLFAGVGVTGQPDINYDYVGYELGNDILGTYKSFYLFGQRFIFDGFQIWIASFTGSLFQTKDFICSAIGMQLIGVSPTEIFFLSTFDNSLYSFNGGRALTKVKRMNDLRNSSNGVETIINGVYNVRDNTLLMQTASTFVWVRDGVVSQTNKKATQAGTMFLYDTQAGIAITNGTTKAWSYSFATQGTTTTTGGTALSSVVPLTWQSAYHSLKGNELSVAMAWIITVFSPEGPITMPYTLRCHAFDQDKYTLQRADGTIRPADWDALGFARMRIQPKNEKALASSIQFDTLQHIVITDITVLYGDEAQGVIAGARSR
jgi:hypothetical protein